MRRIAVAFLVLLGALVASAADVPADRILTGGRIWTADDARPWAEALAIRGDRIVYVGDAAGVRALRGPKTELVELAGRLVTPGFNDSHIHIGGGALSLEQVDLIEEQDLAAVQA